MRDNSSFISFELSIEIIQPLSNENETKCYILIPIDQKINTTELNLTSGKNIFKYEFQNGQGFLNISFNKNGINLHIEKRYTSSNAIDAYYPTINQYIINWNSGFKPKGDIHYSNETSEGDSVTYLYLSNTIQCNIYLHIAKSKFGEYIEAIENAILLPGWNEVQLYAHIYLP